MRIYRSSIAPAIACFALAANAVAGPDDFETGPVIETHGPAATVPDAAPLTDNMQFRIAFDIATPAAEGAANRQLESVARLLNMHAKAGLATSQTRAGVVVHGGAAMDLVNDVRFGRENPTAPLIAALVDAGVSITLCGQTAMYRDIGIDDLLPGVTVSVSAMTAHALLQQDGYTLNPF